MIVVSLDGKMVKVCVFIPISTPTLSGKKVTAPIPPPSLSPKVPVLPWVRSVYISLQYCEQPNTNFHWPVMRKSGVKL